MNEYIFIRCLLILTTFSCIASKAVLLGDNENVHYVLTDRYAGVFSHFASVVGLLELYDRSIYKNVSVNFANSGHYYTPEKGPNWWTYYFKPIELGSKKNIRFVDISPLQNSTLAFHGLALPVVRANEIITKYIMVHDNIRKEVKDFIKSNFKDSFVIGVHYRGTDKSVEAPRISYESIVEKIDNFTQIKVKKEKIFVATDEQAFLDFMIERYGNIVVYQEMQRSQSLAPLHYNQQEKQNPYETGLNAVIDCLLLSHCDVLFKTASNLSACSVMFNPKIEVHHLSFDGWEAK